MSGIPGGFTETREADDQIQALCDSVKRKAEEKTGKTFNVFKAISYQSQVVSGINYLIMVHVGEEDYMHLVVYKKLDCYGGGIELSDLQYPKHREDPLVPFWK